VRRRARCGVALVVFWSVVALPTAAGATSWSVGIVGTNAGEATARGGPAAPTGATSACTSTVSNTVTITWAAVTAATSYSVYSSTTSASSGYSVYATGVTTITYTTGALPLGTYWFEVTASIGAHWVSGSSNATAQRTILVAACL
jgi:hypothetical protein